MNIKKKLLNNQEKGFALIMAIFAMVAIAMMGWTLSNLGSNEYESNVRLLESERSLDLAESGGEWAINSLMNTSNWTTTNDTNPDCNNAADWVFHTLSPGRYKVCCRYPTSTELTQTGADRIIEAVGYVPNENNYLGMRKIKFSVNVASIDQPMYVKELFNWNNVIRVSGNDHSYIEGDITVVDSSSSNDGYEGNNNTVHNETADKNVPERSDGTYRNEYLRETVDDDSGFESIDMEYFLAAAGLRVWSPAAVSANILTVTDVDNYRLRIKLNAALFAGTAPGPSGSTWTNQVFLRNRRNDASDLETRWLNKNWGYIETVNASDTVTIVFDSSVANIRLSANGRWSIGDLVTIGRRFYYNSSHSSPDHDYDNETLWYVKGDLLLDVRSDDLSFNSTSLVAEGDMVIKGDQRVTMVAARTTTGWGWGWWKRRRKTRTTYPNLATQNGNILSADTPTGNHDDQKRDNRNFDGLIYTEFGNIIFNYIDGRTMMGKNVTLRGLIRIRFNSRYVRDNGFIGAYDDVVWQEQ